MDYSVHRSPALLMIHQGGGGCITLQGSSGLMSLLPLFSPEMPRGLYLSGSTIDASSQLTKPISTPGGSRITAVVSGLLSAAWTESSEAHFGSRSLSLSPGMCAFAAF